MNDLIPQSIAGRTILVLVVGLMLSHVVSLGIYYGDRLTALTLLGGGHNAERVATLTRLLDKTPAEDRPRIVDALNQPRRWVLLSPGRPSVRGAPDNWRTILLRKNLHSHMGKAGMEMMVVNLDPDKNLVEGGENKTMGMMEMAGMDPARHAGPVVAVAIRLSDATWAAFSLPVGRTAPFLTLRFILSMSVMLLTVIFVAIWASRRVTAPLASFARAAERLGKDVKAPRLPDEGPSEVRLAAGAFNEMQSRIRRYLEDRTQMVAAMSHDLRTPITRLRLRSDFALDEEQQRKMLADLDEMEQMISSTLSFARDEAASEPTAMVDLTALLQTLCDDLTDTGFSVRLQRQERLTFECHPAALRRAFSNLIENAAKYGQRARVTMTNEAKAVVVQIDDDGPGIPEDRLQHVFRPFVRLDESRSRETGGVGLGLTVARSVIYAHGGTVSLANRPEGGLRVEVRLPR